MGEQLSFFPEENKQPEENKKIEKIIELNTGEKISVPPEIKVSQGFLHVIFIIEKPDGVKVKKVFQFDLSQPRSKPKIKSSILIAPEGLRVFDSPISQETHSTVSYVCWQRIKKYAYAIFRDKLKAYKQSKK